MEIFNGSREVKRVDGELECPAFLDEVMQPCDPFESATAQSTGTHSALSTSASSGDFENDFLKDAFSGEPAGRTDPFEESEGSDDEGEAIPVTEIDSVWESGRQRPDLSRFRPPGVTIHRPWPYHIEGEELVASLPILTRCSGCPPAQLSTTILLDWDDTIFPSTWMHLLQRGLWQRHHQQDESYPPAVTDTHLHLYKRCHLSPDQQAHLAILEDSALNLLQICYDTGNLNIVTNAESGWVELSASHFMPRVHHFLTTAKVPIISARACYATFLAEATTLGKRVPGTRLFDRSRADEHFSMTPSEACNEPDLWKLHTFALLIGRVASESRRSTTPEIGRRCGGVNPRVRYRSMPTERRREIAQKRSETLRLGASGRRMTAMQFVSIGDSECERRALLSCRERFYSQGVFKSIKLVENSHPLLLKRQQDYLATSISTFIQVHDCVDLVFDAPAQVPTAAVA